MLRNSSVLWKSSSEELKFQEEFNGIDFIKNNGN